MTEKLNISDLILSRDTKTEEYYNINFNIHIPSFKQYTADVVDYDPTDILRAEFEMALDRFKNSEL